MGDVLIIFAALAGWGMFVSIGLERLVTLFKKAHPNRIVFSEIKCVHAAREADGTQTWVEDCPSCSTRHRVLLVLYGNPPEGATHWYFCPTNRDPVSAAMSLKLSTKAI